LLLDRTVKALERLTGLVAEDDLVCHGLLQASLSLDLIPGDKRLASLDAGASLTGCGSISEVFEQLGQFVWRQALQFSSDGSGDDRGYPFTVLGDVHNPAARGLMGGLGHAWRSLNGQIAHDSCLLSLPF
jgi:hypothetical protein